jgi:hypothetical protein
MDNREFAVTSRSISSPKCLLTTSAQANDIAEKKEKADPIIKINQQANNDEWKIE